MDVVSKLSINEIKDILDKEEKISNERGITWEISKDETLSKMNNNTSFIFIDKNTKEEKKNIEIKDCIFECDNIVSMVALLRDKSMGETFDIIIFDPPYNTGDSKKSHKDSFKYWLSFMYKRLMLAKELLMEEGVIYICINDKELANLKLLCDKVFGSKNYINLIGIKTSTGGGNSRTPKRLRKDLEYVLVYSKKYSKCKFKRLKIEYDFFDFLGKTDYKNVMKDLGKKKLVLQDEEKTIYYYEDYERMTIKQVAKIENISEREVYKKYLVKIFSDTNSNTDVRERAYRIIKEKYGKELPSRLLSQKYISIKGEDKGNEVEKYYWITKGENIREIIWLKKVAMIEGDTIRYTKELGDLWTDINFNSLNKEGNIEFKEAKKPVHMFERLLRLYEKKDCLIGDFFAGSGTTAEAVKKLNDLDNGKRHFILCNIEENNICEEKTYKRTKRIYPDVKMYRIKLRNQ